MIHKTENSDKVHEFTDSRSIDLAGFIELSFLIKKEELRVQSSIEQFSCKQPVSGRDSPPNGLEDPTADRPLMNFNLS